MPHRMSPRLPCWRRRALGLLLCSLSLVSMASLAAAEGAHLRSIVLWPGEQLVLGYDRDDDGEADIWYVHTVYWRGWSPATDADLQARSLKEARAILANTEGPEPMQCGLTYGPDWRYVYILSLEPVQTCLDPTCGAT